jgi:cytochrome bd-type quinol oxidase subunit 2
MRGEETATSFFNSLGDFYSVLEFVACVLTYLTTAAFAAALGRARWFGRGAARAYVTASTVCLLLLVMRGLSYPEISGNTAPWYTRPGVIVGIPAIPWIMPCLLGVVLLRRAGGARDDGISQSTELLHYATREE